MGWRRWQWRSRWREHSSVVQEGNSGGECAEATTGDRGRGGEDYVKENKEGWLES